MEWVIDSPFSPPEKVPKADEESPRVSGLAAER
jgi:hypothetical protein